MMVSDGEQRIDAIMVLTPTEKPTPPCGGCLQRLVEFASPTATVHMCTQDGHAEDHQPLSRLLPAAFNHDHLRTPHD